MTLTAHSNTPTINTSHFNQLIFHLLITNIQIREDFFTTKLVRMLLFYWLLCILHFCQMAAVKSALLSNGCFVSCSLHFCQMAAM